MKCCHTSCDYRRALTATMSYIRKPTDMGWPDLDALWMYNVLPEPFLSSELSRLSSANSIGDTDVVTFQPCPNPKFLNEDRFVIEDWPLSNGTWSFRAIFDGRVSRTVLVIISNLFNLPRSRWT
jgi:hypothetical protein